MIHLPEINSTNTFLRQLSAECDIPNGFAIRADFQTSGYGQATNTWESERGKNLLCSVFLNPENIELYSQFALSQIVSIAIVDVLQNYIEKPVKIKWPNDIYVEDNKICGILIENSILGNRWSHSIVGIGINVNQEIFKSNAPNPISIKQISNIENDVDEILRFILDKIINSLQTYTEEKYQELKNQYFKYLYRNVGEYEYLDCNTGEIITATIQDIRPNGHIVLKVKLTRCHHLSSKSKEEYEYRSYAFKEIKFI